MSGSRSTKGAAFATLSTISGLSHGSGFPANPPLSPRRLHGALHLLDLLHDSRSSARRCEFRTPHGVMTVGRLHV